MVLVYSRANTLVIRCHISESFVPLRILFTPDTPAHAFLPFQLSVA
jgi:hypothetical protein